ncbi:MAG: Zn-ribbon-containing protein [Alkalimonas sp.]|nr:Zn-ribbon-containing protein [Alkalimonas sp.]
MWVAELRFRLIADTKLSMAEQQIRRYLETLIFNGQILGREFPSYQTDDAFCSRVVLPAQDALAKQHHSLLGLAAMEALAQAGLAYPQLSLLGADLMSSHTDPCQVPEYFIVFNHFAENISPVRCAEHFAPVPLYRLQPTGSKQDHEELIRWQLQYQALDEIQMQQDRVVDKSAEKALQGLHSKLNRQGRRFARRIEQQEGKACYYYLYSGSSPDCQAEATKACPSCGAPWRLEQSWHELFQFRCEPCRLVSNIAWDCQ